MINAIVDLGYGMQHYIVSIFMSGKVLNLFLYYFPFILFLEMPYYALTVAYSITGL